MALRIVPPSEPIPIETIVLCIYAAPGTGKTSLAQTAEAPLTYDFDNGIYRAFNRKSAVQVAQWEDADTTSEELEPFSTIVVDTAGRALDVLSRDIIGNNPKAGRADGSLTLQGFGTLKSRFAQWQSFLRAQGRDIILLCHMDEQKNGDDTTERIDAQGSSKNEIYKVADAMCRIRLDNRDNRYLDFDPRQGGYGKNPAQLKKVPVPNLKDNPLFLAGIIAQIKAALNHLTEAQAAAVKEQEDWDASMAQLTDPADAAKAVRLAGDNKVALASALRRLFVLCEPLALFNEHVVPLMKIKGEVLTEAVKATKLRKWRADKASGLYVEAVQ